MLAVFQQNKSTRKSGTIIWGQAQAFTKPLNVRKTSPVPPYNPSKLQKLRPLKETNAFTSGQVPCFCPGVTMKLVITTNELSPCGDTANKLIAGMAFSDGVCARSLSLGQGIGHPNHWGMARQMAPFSLTLGPLPSSAAAWEAGGGPWKLQCHQPQGQWRTPLTA